MCEIGDKDVKKILADLEQIKGVLIGDEYHKNGLIESFNIAKKRIDMMDIDLLKITKEIELLKLKIKEIKEKNAKTNKSLRQINRILYIGYGALGVLYLSIKFIVPLIAK